MAGPVPAHKYPEEILLKEGTGFTADLAQGSLLCPRALPGSYTGPLFFSKDKAGNAAGNASGNA